MHTRTIRSAVYLAGGLGLIVSIFTYLESVEASLQGLCTVNAFVSCSAVANSGKTTLFGIGDSFIGIAGFVVIILVAAIVESRPSELTWSYLLLFITSGGVAFSFYFGYVELVEIHALCLVCFTAYIFGFIVWGGSIALAGRARSKARIRRLKAPAAAPTPKATPRNPRGE